MILVILCGDCALVISEQVLFIMLLVLLYAASLLGGEVER